MVLEEFVKEMKNFYKQMSEITTELAVTSSNLKNISEQMSKANEKQDKFEDDIRDLQTSRDQAKGAISFLKIFSGLISLILVASFSWVFNTSSWIAKIDQWKIQVEEKLK